MTRRMNGHDGTSGNSLVKYDYDGRLGQELFYLPGGMLKLWNKPSVLCSDSKERVNI